VDSIAKLSTKIPVLRSLVQDKAFFRGFFSWLFDFSKAKVRGCVGGSGRWVLGIHTHVRVQVCVGARARVPFVHAHRFLPAPSLSPALACVPMDVRSLAPRRPPRKDQRVIQLDIAIDTIQLVMSREMFPLVDLWVAFLKVRMS